MRIFRRPRWADVRADAFGLLEVLLWLGMAAFVWRGLVTLYPRWMAVPLLIGSMWALISEGRAAHRRWARRRRP